MSMNRMITKLALAFAAKKGVEMLQSAGGIEGLKRAFSNGPTAGGGRGGMPGRIGGSTDATTGGLGNLLGSLGIGGATDAREAGVTGQINPMNQTLGGLFGTLSASLSGQSTTEQATSGQRMVEQLNMRDVNDADEARPIVRAMVQMARADGSIDQDEQDALFDLLDDANPEERRILESALRDPVDAKSIARDTPWHGRKEVYSAALLVGNPDNAAERAFLSDLASALDLKEDEIEALHAGMGKQPVAA